MFSIQVRISFSNRINKIAPCAAAGRA